MHLTDQQVLPVVLSALAAINESKPASEQFVPKPETPLVGQGAVLSSLELVTFILEVEARLVEDFGLQITLTDDRAFSQARSPFRRPRALAEYIVASAELPAPETA
jgi:hypothetical protein